MSQLPIEKNLQEKPGTPLTNLLFSSSLHIGGFFFLDIFLS